MVAMSQLPMRVMQERRLQPVSEGGRPVIEVVGLTKRFGDRVAVDGVELTVPAGRAFGLLGHNGAGKTTLIRMLLGLTSPDAGDIKVLGQSLPGARAAALARVGAIVEEPRFYGHLSGRENLRAFAAVRGPEARTRIPAVLARVGLSERANDKVATYSMGMRQRLGLARCLLADPQLLILDEPTNGLDPGGMLAFRTLVRELVDEEGRTVFISSHLLDEVQRICSAAAIVDHGRVIAHGTIAELLDDQADGDVLIGCDDPTRALAIVRARLGIEGIETTPTGLRIPIGGRGAAARINAALVAAGIDVWRLESSRRSLEEHFLALTRLETGR
jgi:ABC-2 type transport system ATP-binding protein